MNNECRTITRVAESDPHLFEPLNVATADHISSVCGHAIRDVQNNRTLKATRDYLEFQLLTRIKSADSSLKDIHAWHCRRTLIILHKCRTRAGFIAAAQKHMDTFAAFSHEQREAQRAALKAEKPGKEIDGLKHMIAQLLEDARRLQDVEPSAGTAARIKAAGRILSFDARLDRE